jgi:hypothetical protein
MLMSLTKWSQNYAAKMIKLQARVSGSILEKEVSRKTGLASLKMGKAGS